MTTPAKAPIFTPGSTDVPKWMQFTPKGTFWHDDAQVNQLLDDKATAAMVNRLNEEKEKAGANWAGLLIDFDHFSNDTDKSSEAAGWLMSLENRADGMWGEVNLSDEGTKAVKGLRFKFTSPVWKPSDCEVVNRDTSTIRPLRLDRAALTNDPNLKGMAPITNRAELEAFHPIPAVEPEPEELMENRACTKDDILNYGTSAGAKKGWETRRSGMAQKSDLKGSKAPSWGSRS